MNIKYFDHAATTPIKREVLAEMRPYLNDEFGNPSSIHIKGVKAKEAIEIAREEIASCIKANKNEIYFTSGGTEADNTAIKGFARANKKKGKHIITTQIEHKAILEACKELEDEGFEISYVGVDEYGIVDLEELKDAIKENTILISVMFANNEIGSVQPIKRIGEIAREHNVAFHTDAVQAMGNIRIDVEEMNIDMLSMSGHKFYGPKGVGALYVSERMFFKPIISGGGQEKNKRGGTENVASIVGMGKALIIANQNIEKYNDKVYELSRTFLDEIDKRNIKVKLNGHPLKRLKGNLNLTLKGVDAESLLLLLSEKGFCISTASACSSNSKKISHVLRAIGLSEDEAKGTIRITFGEGNEREDVKYLAKEIEKIVYNLNEMR